MNRAEALQKYGDLVLKFASYYKYAFTYRGVAEDGSIVEMDVGGNADAIYRYQVTPNSTDSLNGDQWFAVQIMNSDTVIWTENRY
jgi:hypothetical protein